MGYLHADARSWAQDHSPLAEVKFTQLEATAFQRHPEIVEYFGLQGAVMAGRHDRSTRMSPRQRLALTFFAVLLLVAFFAPITAVAVMSGDRFGYYFIDPEQSLPIAAFCLTIGALGQAALFVAWLVRGARFTWVEWGVHLVGVAMSLIALTMISAVVDLDAIAGGGQARLWAVVSLAVAGAAALGMLVRFRVRPLEARSTVDADAGPGEDAEVGTGAEADAMRGRVAALPAEEREAILADRDAALAVLRERRIISDAMLQRARAQELGMLYRLDARR